MSTRPRHKEEEKQLTRRDSYGWCTCKKFRRRRRDECPLSCCKLPCPTGRIVLKFRNPARGRPRGRPRSSRKAAVLRDRTRRSRSRSRKASRRGYMLCLVNRCSSCCRPAGHGLYSQGARVRPLHAMRPWRGGGGDSFLTLSLCWGGCEWCSGV